MKMGRFHLLVIPAHAGIQVRADWRISLDIRFRGYDGRGDEA